MTRDEVLDLPVVVPATVAGEAFDMSRMSTYTAIKEDRFPVPVIRNGRKIMVRRADLLRELGIAESA